jgi:hypothetical protein
MKHKFAVGLGFAVFAAQAWALPITPAFTTYGSLPVGTNFGGSGIPIDETAITDYTKPGVALSTIKLGLKAHARFSNPTPTDNNAGTYFVQTGVDTNAPSPANPYARWNVGVYVSGNTNLYDFKFVYDFNPAAANDISTHGQLTPFVVSGNPGTGGLYQASFNMGFDFLTGAFPGFNAPPPGATLTTFNPNALGQYTFALVAFNKGTTNEVARSAILVTAVPEASTYAMLLAGLAAVGFVAKRRRA